MDKDKRILIADFGLARDIYVADYYKIEDRSLPLPIRWMAIESMEIQKFTTKSDVVGFGQFQLTALCSAHTGCVIRRDAKNGYLLHYYLLLLHCV